MATDVTHYPAASQVTLERSYDELRDLGRAVSRPLDVAELRARVDRMTSLAAELFELAEAEGPFGRRGGPPRRG
jgi:hypothetical protein